MLNLEIKFDPMDMTLNLQLSGESYSESELAAFVQYIIEKHPDERTALNMAGIFISNKVFELNFSKTRFLDDRYLEINLITTNGVNK